MRRTLAGLLDEGTPVIDGAELADHLEREKALLPGIFERYQHLNAFEPYRLALSYAKERLERTADGIRQLFGRRRNRREISCRLLGSHFDMSIRGNQIIRNRHAFDNFDAFFQELYDLFARAECWRLFEDTLPVLNELKAKGFDSIVAK